MLDLFFSFDSLTEVPVSDPVDAGGFDQLASDDYLEFTITNTSTTVLDKLGLYVVESTTQDPVIETDITGSYLQTLEIGTTAVLDGGAEVVANDADLSFHVPGGLWIRVDVDNSNLWYRVTFTQGSDISTRLGDFELAVGTSATFHIFFEQPALSTAGKLYYDVAIGRL